MAARFHWVELKCGHVARHQPGEAPIWRAITCLDRRCKGHGQNVIAFGADTEFQPPRGKPERWFNEDAPYRAAADGSVPLIGWPIRGRERPRLPTLDEQEMVA